MHAGCRDNSESDHTGGRWASLDNGGDQEMQRIMRLPEVLGMIGMRRSWLFDEIKAGRFPAGIKLGVRARGWTVESIEAWLEERAEQSR